jgi:hypothetical protein
MALGTLASQQAFDDPVQLLGDRLAKGSIYRLLADEGAVLFFDEYFADLYTDSTKGRPTVPARILATVMLLQAFEGLSDREACDRLAFDLRWQAAAGVRTGIESFHPTVLVGLRNRLRSSSRPRRLFEDTVTCAKTAGAVSSKVRVLDSTPLFDAVGTQDTLVQVRAAIRKVLNLSDASLRARLKAVLLRDDDYLTPGKPVCDWDDCEARLAVVDDLVKDGLLALEVLEQSELSPSLTEAAELLALVCGQDVAQDNGRFVIVRGVAKDRVISVVDTEARHGHKSMHRRFDGYKSHLAIEAESEIITEVSATAANVSDREVVDELLSEVIEEPGEEVPVVVGDSAYASGETRATLEQQGVVLMSKVPAINNGTGGFSKDRFVIDLQQMTVTCPANHTVRIVSTKARFSPHCSSCSLRSACTSAASGRTVSIHRHERLLQQARAEQQGMDWQERYRALRPRIERKIAHFVRRAWGGRNARVRGLQRVLTDVDTRAGAINWARLAVLGLRSTPAGWTIA